mmetsp:Transcript_36716/g.103610  ORF Transcript_36716/g.103610 Transcript_36716/m.103610 type:complete len:207 (+) Transcript_36716:667-1287(+)
MPRQPPSWSGPPLMGLLPAGWRHTGWEAPTLAVSAVQSCHSSCCLLPSQSRQQWRKWRMAARHRWWRAHAGRGNRRWQGPPLQTKRPRCCAAAACCTPQHLPPVPGGSAADGSVNGPRCPWPFCCWPAAFSSALQPRTALPVSAPLRSKLPDACPKPQAASGSVQLQTGTPRAPPFCPKFLQSSGRSLWAAATRRGDRPTASLRWP